MCGDRDRVMERGLYVNPNLNVYVDAVEHNSFVCGRKRYFVPNRYRTTRADSVVGLSYGISVRLDILLSLKSLKTQN